METAGVSVLEVIEDDNWLWEPGQIIAVPLGRPAIIDDLRRTRHKAEIVNGEVLVIGPSGGTPANAAGNIIACTNGSTAVEPCSCRALRIWWTFPIGRRSVLT